VHSVATQKLTLDRNSALGYQLLEDLPSFIFGVVPSVEGLLVRTTQSQLRALAFLLRNYSQFQLKVLVDLAVVDRLKTVSRFSVNYLLVSVLTNQRLTLQVFTAETATIPSLAVPYAKGQRLFAASGWLEREV